VTIGQHETPDAAPVPTGTPPEAPPARPHTIRWVVVALGIVALIVGVWIVSVRLPGWLTRPDVGAVSTDGTTGTAAESRRIQATLFYVAEDGTTLVPTSRNVPYGATPVEQARRLIEAQVADPPEGLLSPVPSGTTVRAVFLTDAQEAYVDLGGTIVSGHSGGSLDEALTVYAIVNALTVNLPEVTAVQILIEGREVDSLRGHIDLRVPLAKATDWIQKGPAAQ
jgi:predicted secreted protein